MSVSEPSTKRVNTAWTRLLCYLFGPVSAGYLLLSRTYNRAWAIRFHAVQSIVFFAAWLLVWSILELAEGLSTWLLASVIDDIQFGLNCAGLLAWGALMHAAHQGRRLVVIQPFHVFASRLASHLFNDRRPSIDTSSIWSSFKAATRSMQFRVAGRTFIRTHR
jgi:uncharacterized membrane protein